MKTPPRSKMPPLETALGLARIVSVIHPENEPSKNVLRKLGRTFLRLVRLSFAAEREFEL